MVKITKEINLKYKKYGVIPTGETFLVPMYNFYCIKTEKGAINLKTGNVISLSLDELVIITRVDAAISLQEYENE